MKPIPIKATSRVFGAQKKDLNQHINSLALMKYYHEHVPGFKKMWKEQGKEYWIQFLISLIHSFKKKDLSASKDPEEKLFIEKKTVYALQNITDNLAGHSFPAINKMMEMIYKMYKDFYKVILPSITTVELPKEDQNLYAVFDYLFGSECEFPSVTAFAELCALYSFAAESLTRICQEFESNKYQSTDSPNQKDYWEIPLKWHRSNYKPTIFEIKLVASYETLVKKFIKQEGKDVKWITDNLDEIKNSCKHNEELSLLPKELEMSKDGLKDLYSWCFLMTPVMLPELTDDYSDVSSDVLIHPFNQSYLTYYNSVFNARFWATVTEEFRALYGILQKKKVDLDDEELNARMLELCKLTSLIEKISQYTFDQLTETDFHLYFDREMEITTNNKEDAESDISCSSLLEVKSKDEWKSWDPKDNAHLESHQATLDRMPWDIPFLMSWQENMFAALLKIDIGAIPLRIYPVVEKYKQTIINFNRLLKDSLFLMYSSMIIADHVYYLEGEKNYNWTNTIDYRKTLHEIGYRLRSVIDFVDMPGQNAVTSLVRKAWDVDKSALRPKWEPGAWENIMDLERFFVHSRRHYLHWDWAPKPYETKKESFKEAYQKIISVKFNKKNCENNCYYEVNKNFSRFDLDETEKVFVKSFRQNLKLDTSQACDVFSKAHYITKQEASRFQKKLTSGKVPQEAVAFINFQGFIFKKCQILRDKMNELSEEVDLNRPKFIELMIQHRQFICGFKINYAMQQFINDDPKFCPKPTNALIEKALAFSEEKAFQTLEQSVIEDVVVKYRKRIWADKPIPPVPKNSIPELKKEHSFKPNFWKTQSTYHNYSLMEKHRTELLRIVIDKYFSFSPGATNVSLFPYWKTLVCFIPSELFVLVGLHEADWDTKECIAKIFQLSNYRLIWMREKVMEWCKNSEIKPKESINVIKNSEISHKLGEQYIRLRLAGNTLRDLYVSRFTVNEELQPITKGIINFNVLIEVLLNKVFDDLSKISDIGVTVFKNCFLESAEELVEYMETLLEHACLCWNYKTLEFHEDFRPMSFENCESTIYIAKQLLYLCLTRIANKEDFDGEIELCLLKAHSMESEIIDQKAVRGPSSPENDDYDLYMACMDTWRSFTNMYEKAVKKDVPIPEAFTKGSRSWKKILENFKEDKLVKISKFLKIDVVTKSWGFNNFSHCPTCPECEEDLIWELKNLGIVNTKKKCEEKHETKKAEKSEEKKKEVKKNEEKKSEEKKNEKPASAKRSNINKKQDYPEDFQPEDKLIVKALNDAVKNSQAYSLGGKSNVEGNTMYVTRLKIDQSSFKLGEFDLDKSSDTFKKLVADNFKKNQEEVKKREEKLKKNEEKLKKNEEELKKLEEELKKREAEEKKKNGESCGVNIAAEGFKKMFGTLAKPKINEVEKSKGNDKEKVENANGATDKIEQSKDKNKICASCKKKAGEGVKFKKCSKCKEENVPNPKFYCGRECQLKDWADCHRQEHTISAQGK